MLGLFARKIGMTQVFDENGLAVPVTVLEILENVVTQVKSNQGKDGYNAVQIGAEAEAKEYRLTKAEVGHCKKNELPAFRTLGEFRVSSEDLAKYALGAALDPTEVLGDVGSDLELVSRPKGRGTSGRIQRWNQHRRTMSHGTKHHRQIGSAGAGTTPGRVIKGKKMPGRDSNKVTICSKLVKCDTTQSMLLVRGAVPGPNGTVVVVKPRKPRKGWNAYARSLATLAA